MVYCHFVRVVKLDVVCQDLTCSSHVKLWDVLQSSCDGTGAGITDLVALKGQRVQLWDVLQGSRDV